MLVMKECDPRSTTLPVLGGWGLGGLEVGVGISQKTIYKPSTPNEVGEVGVIQQVDKPRGNQRDQADERVR